MFASQHGSDGIVFGYFEVSTGGETLSSHMHRSRIQLLHSRKGTCAKGMIECMDIMFRLSQNIVDSSQVSGYHQKLHRIVNSFAASLKALANDVTEDQYNVFVEQQSKNFENIFVKPDSINKDFRLSIIDTNHIPLPAKNRILKTITFNDFKDFCHLYLQEIRIKAVMQGNLDAASAENIMTDVLQVLDCGKVQDVSPKLLES